MSKAVVNMINWELYVYNNKYNLSGTADEHPRLGKKIYVEQTSDLVDAELENDILRYETRNTIYICPLKYMTVRPYRSVVERYKKELSHLADGEAGDLDKIIAAAAQISLKMEKGNEFFEHLKQLQEEGWRELIEIQEKDNKRLMDIAKQYEDCIYIEASNIAEGDTLAYYLAGETGIVYPQLHVGMFQDSVLYISDDMDTGEEFLDFRYFPIGLIAHEMETYSCSDNIKQVVIKNEREETIIFNKVEIEPGETKVFKHERSKKN